MIYDSLDRLGSYRGLSRNLDAAMEYLAAHDLEGLSDGRSPIDGDRLFCNVMSYETKEASAAKYEAHRRYIDIQILLEGREDCFYLPLEGLPVLEEFSAERDVGFYSEAGVGGLGLPLAKGLFALFFPHDAHKPGCQRGGKCRVRKVVVKVEL
jgi:biofilm protein TabA